MTALAAAALAVSAILFAPAGWIAPALGLLLLLCIAELFMLTARKTQLLTPAGLYVNTLGVLVLAVAFSALALIAQRGGNLALLYVIACVKLSDMGGFALGVAFGRHKMCPTISPNKSWEGMFGSLLASSLISCAFIPWTGFGIGKSIAIGLVAAVLGTGGDLVESKFKRWVGVKDSGTFMPAGLGGMLDMFDSLLFAPAVLWAIMSMVRG